MMAEAKNKGGRPMKFKTVEELQKKIDEYFAECDKQKRPYTITGLALALDTNRATLLDYEKKYEQFSEVVKKAKLRIENYAEEQLFTSKNVAGVIFNLMNNFGWKNRQDVDASIGGKEGEPLQVVFNIPRPKKD